jgi:hypothetical protein
MTVVALGLVNCRVNIFLYGVYRDVSEMEDGLGIIHIYIVMSIYAYHIQAVVYIHAKDNAICGVNTPWKRKRGYLVVIRIGEKR